MEWKQLIFFTNMARICGLLLVIASALVARTIAMGLHGMGDGQCNTPLFHRYSYEGKHFIDPHYSANKNTLLHDIPWTAASFKASFISPFNSTRWSQIIPQYHLIRFVKHHHIAHNTIRIWIVLPSLTWREAKETRSIPKSRIDNGGWGKKSVFFWSNIAIGAAELKPSLISNVLYYVNVVTRGMRSNSVFSTPQNVSFPLLFLPYSLP